MHTNTARSNELTDDGNGIDRPVEGSEDELREEALEASAGGLLVVDEVGDVIYANPSAAELFGRPLDQLIGNPFGFPVGSDPITDLELLGPDRQRRVVEVRTTRTRWEDRSVYVVALADVSDRAERTDALRREVELGAAVVANVSHQLKNPITVVTGYAETLRRYWSQLDDDEKLELVDRIIGTGRRMNVTVQNLLRLSKVEAGHTGADQQRVDLSDVLLGRLVEIGDQARNLTVDCPRGATAWVDPVQLWEIVLNLIENGLKYGEPPIAISVRTAGARVFISVCDSGPGVPEEFVPALFERFTRAREVADDKDGSGLGLAIGHALAEANGGELRYRPGKPTGACFELELPAEPVD